METTHFAVCSGKANQRWKFVYMIASRQQTLIKDIVTIKDIDKGNNNISESQYILSNAKK